MTIMLGSTVYTGKHVDRVLAGECWEKKSRSPDPSNTTTPSIPSQIAIKCRVSILVCQHMVVIPIQPTITSIFSFSETIDKTETILLYWIRPW